MERTFARLGLSRRLSREYKPLPETAEAMIYAVMSRTMLHRLARTACRDAVRRVHGGSFESIAKQVLVYHTKSD